MPLPLSTAGGTLHDFARRRLPPLPLQAQQQPSSGLHRCTKLDSVAMPHDLDLLSPPKAFKAEPVDTTQSGLSTGLDLDLRPEWLATVLRDHTADHCHGYVEPCYSGPSVPLPGCRTLASLHEAYPSPDRWHGSRDSGRHPDRNGVPKSPRQRTFVSSTPASIKAEPAPVAPAVASSRPPTGSFSTIRLSPPPKVAPRPRPWAPPRPPRPRSPRHPYHRRTSSPHGGTQLGFGAIDEVAALSDEGSIWPPSLASGLPESLRRRTSPSKSTRVRFTDLSRAVFPPSPAIGSTHSTPFTLLTPQLGRLAASQRLIDQFEPVRVARPLRALERGYWIIDTAVMPDPAARDFWLYLERWISDGRAGWGVMAFRNATMSNALGRVRIYCFGEAAPHVWILAFVASRGMTRRSSAWWIDADEEVILEM